MAYIDYEFKVLDLADRGQLPDTVTDDVIAPIIVFRELVDGQLLYGEPLVVGGRIEGYEFLAIRLEGRRRIADLRTLRESQTAKARAVAFFKWACVIAGTSIVTLGIQWLAKCLGITS